MPEARLDDASVLAKVMKVLHAFTLEDHGVGFAELQRRTGLAKATLHRLLGDMVIARLLDRDDAGSYRLGGNLFELGMRASVERTLLEVATPFLEDLYERTHETVHLAVREGTDVVYVAKVTGHRRVDAPSRVGGRQPLHSTALGKSLLAYAPEAVRREVLGEPLARLAPRTIVAPGRLAAQLAEVRSAGVAFEFEESRVGVVCVGAPILLDGDRAVGAISVTGPITRFEPQRHAAAVKVAASGIAALLARGDALNVT